MSSRFSLSTLSHRQHSILAKVTRISVEPDNLSTFNQTFPKSPFLSPSSLDAQSLHRLLPTRLKLNHSSSSDQVRGALRSLTTFTFVRFRLSSSLPPSSHTISNVNFWLDLASRRLRSLWDKDCDPLRRMCKVWYRLDLLLLEGTPETRKGFLPPTSLIEGALTSARNRSGKFTGSFVVRGQILFRILGFRKENSTTTSGHARVLRFEPHLTRLCHFWEASQALKCDSSSTSFSFVAKYSDLEFGRINYKT